MKVSPEQMLQARLDANMSRGDLAHALRRITSSRIKATERGIRGWEKGEYAPSVDVIPAYAIATDKSLDYFYEDAPGEAPFPVEPKGRRARRAA